jgi:hypothetical protein
VAQAQAPIRDNPPVTESERLMNLFVHDLRAPLGVATGYLRLLQDGRLGTDLDQRMALTRTLDALGRIATLCDAVSEAGTHPDPQEPVGRLTPDDLIARVVAALKTPTALEAHDGWAPGAAVTVGRDGDRFARSIAVVIGALARRSPSAIVKVSPNGDAVRFTLNSHADSTSAAVPFDPWRGFGLEVVLACQAIEATGGVVRTGGDADLAIELPTVRSDAR